jgi:DNA repair exonuclease SbcCD ATPase subunit
MNYESDTPETDNACGFYDLETAVDANFARKLERERDELSSRFDDLAKAYEVSESLRRRAESELTAATVDGDYCRVNKDYWFMLIAKRDEAREERDELNKEIEALRITLNTTAKHLHNTNQSRNAYAINFRKSEVKRLEVENERDALQRISDEAIANELNIRAERDEAMKERNAALSDRDAWARLCGAVDCYTPSTAEPYEALKLQRDALRAEVERLKRQLMGDNESALMLSDMTEEIQQLRADKARLDWIKALDCDSPVWGVLCDTTKLRETIDAAMKGEL